MGGYTPVMPKPIPLDEVFAREASEVTSGTIPKNVLKTWFNAHQRFKNNGPEYIQIWREAYLDLCVEDGYIEHQWTSENLMRALNHYYELWDKVYNYTDYPYDPSKLNYKPLGPPPKKP